MTERRGSERERLLDVAGRARAEAEAALASRAKAERLKAPVADELGLHIGSASGGHRSPGG